MNLRISEHAYYYHSTHTSPEECDLTQSEATVTEMIKADANEEEMC